jgi:transforming growth factor-beta-induced protein
MKKTLVFSLLAALLIAACAPAPQQAVEPTPMPAEPMEEPMPDLVDVAVEAGSFSTLVAAVQAAGLEDALRGEGPFTVFAPSDEAFAKLPEGTVEALLEDPQGALSRILLYHVVPGKVMAADVSDGLTAETLRGAEVSFSIMEGMVKINDASIVATDIEASNGVIHVIDSVILPPADIVDVAAEAGSFNTLIAAVQAAGLEETLRSKGPFTVFAPTDEAFAKLPEGTVEALLADPEALANILLYHVVPGKVMAADVSDGLEAETAQGSSVRFAIHSDGAPAIEGALITATDIEAFNGVIHVIDSVILPPKDIVDTAIEAGSFSTLIAAVQAAGLEEALRGEGPFTVFAPTDAAFAALPAGTVESLLAEPQGALKDILLYHVLSGKVMAADVTDGLEAETLLGQMVSFALHSGGAVTINGARITVTDIRASNGVIHVIDAVILPPA